MGSTMRATIEACKNARAARIVVAAPVSSAETARDIGRLVDDVEVLEHPRHFRAVAQVYRNWYDVSDEEVLAILRRWDEGQVGG
jgi:predicted phosphoribosyltransferase